jgi:hypothetical protein
MNNMIQEFLNLQFIQISDDSNFEKLKKSCTEITKKIGKDRSKILSYSLVAFDPDVTADNPEIIEVNNIIIDNWQTFLPNSKDTHITIIRAVMLEALRAVAKDKTENAGLIWFSVRNLIKHFKLGREKEILSNFLLEIGNQVEKEATESWTLNPKDLIDIPEIVAATIDKTELEVHLKVAAVHSGWGGENPNTQAQNDLNWPTFFASRASKGLADTLNKAFKKQVNEIRIKQSDLIKQSVLMNMRSQLLWWKEACYSYALRNTYREIKEGSMQVTLAYDYSGFIPEIYPKSVDFFLLETHRNLSTVADKKVKISEILKLIEQDNTQMKEVISSFDGDGNRICFMRFIQGLVHGSYKVRQFKSLVGVADSIEITLGEFTLWLFHDLQSIKLSNTK